MALIRPIACELPYAAGVARKRQKKKKKRERKKFRKELEINSRKKTRRKKCLIIKDKKSPGKSSIGLTFIKQQLCSKGFIHTTSLTHITL